MYTQIDMINSESYPAEKHDVYTRDDYILTVYRIPNLNLHTNNQKVILFMHGTMKLKEGKIVQKNFLQLDLVPIPTFIPNSNFMI